MGKAQIPNHVAVIPDGNRRWARRRGLPTLVGHKKGFDVARKIVDVSREMGIHTLTLWGFSTENWSRTRREINYLMKIYFDMIGQNLDEARKTEARMIHLGRKDRLPKKLVEEISQAEEETKKYKKHVLNIALDYGGQDDILRAIEKMAAEFSKSNFQFSNEKLEKYLDTVGQKYPSPDLVIRTSGEMRTSGLMVWQAAYSELYFEPKCFPDFTPELFKKAIAEYGKRQRRFGGGK